MQLNQGQQSLYVQFNSRYTRLDQQDDEGRRCHLGLFAAGSMPMPGYHVVPRSSLSRRTSFTRGSRLDPTCGLPCSSPKAPIIPLNPGCICPVGIRLVGCKKILRHFGNEAVCVPNPVEFRLVISSDFLSFNKAGSHPQVHELYSARSDGRRWSRWVFSPARIQISLGMPITRTFSP